MLKHEFLKELNDVDDGQMLLKFQDGGLGMIEISRNANDVYDTRTEVIGLDKSVFVGQESADAIHNDWKSGNHRGHGKLVSGKI